MGRAWILAALALAWAAAQSGVTIRTTTTLIQVGVAARDSKGQPVEGLTKEDFEILDNGKAQQIAVFHRESAAGAAPAAAALPRGTFTNRAAEDPQASARHSSVILLDWANTGFRNTARAREKAREVVNRLGSDEPIGVYSFDVYGLQVVNEIGSPRAAMLEKLKTLTGLMSPCYQAQLDGLDDVWDDDMKACGQPGGMQGFAAMAQSVKAHYVGQRTRDTLAAFESIAAHLAGVPGRKALIWISSAFPLEIELKPDGNTIFPYAHGAPQTYSAEVERAMTKLENAGVALYPVDARGLGSSDADFSSVDDNTWPTMDYLAKRTGGTAYHGNNGIDVGIEAAIADVQTGYTLGFYAALDSPREGFHKLTVRSLRPGVKLRYKEGYTVDPPAKRGKNERKEAVEVALSAVVDATSIPIQVKATREKNTLKLLFSLWPDTLALTQKGGRWQGAVEVITRFTKDDGREAATPVSKRIVFNLTRRTYEAAQRGGLVFSRTLEAPAKAERLRLLVRNDPSGEIGTVTIPMAGL